MFGLEPWHIVLLLAVLLVIFGPKRLPEIGKNLGESIREFRKATTEFGDSVKAGAAPPPTVPPTAPAPTAPQPTAPIAVAPPVVSAPAAAQETQPAASSGTPQPPTPPAATAG
ncbi:MAG: twin-arginine translocase TatA/TatE family subunit [Candidatus Limnocylindrales bacterium]|jgi:sec-independent protein translocase protein TatA